MRLRPANASSVGGQNSFGLGPARSVLDAPAPTRVARTRQRSDRQRHEKLGGRHAVKMESWGGSDEGEIVGGMGAQGLALCRTMGAVEAL